MVPTNQDQTRTSGAVPWVDHVFPILAFIDGHQAITSWMDFRADSSNTSYRFFEANVNFGTSAFGSWQSLSESSWLSAPDGVWTPLAAGFAQFYDLDKGASAHLHAHFVRTHQVPVFQGPYQFNTLSVVTSPESPQN
jgi:hypothetical protein